jgi:hypothetical protein
MKLTLSPSADQSGENHPHPFVSIEIPGDDLNLTQVFDSLVIPALVAFGFDWNVVQDWMDGNTKITDA